MSSYPQYTIAEPPAPPPQLFTNVPTLITGQADIVGVMLFFRPATGLATLLVEGADYVRMGGSIHMNVAPPAGSRLTAQVFARGKQLGGAAPLRYLPPWAFAVTGAYDGASQSYAINFGPTIRGITDGVNALFTMGVNMERWQVSRNGILQALNYDVVTGPSVLLFQKGSIPLTGDVITALGFNGF